MLFLRPRNPEAAILVNVLLVVVVLDSEVVLLWRGSKVRFRHTCVRPVKIVCYPVDRDAISRGQLISDYCLHVTAIHICPSGWNKEQDN